MCVNLVKEFVLWILVDEKKKIMEKLKDIKLLGKYY